MKIARIEFSGNAARTSVYLDDEGQYLLIYVVPHNMQKRRWDRGLKVSISNEELMKVAREVQYGTDGYHGNDSEVADYFCEMRRFLPKAN